MNYTTHYNLPQWELSDRIMMEDFNQAMADLDAGLAAAQSGADAAYTPDNKPYATGHYTGTGNDVSVTLGYRPSFVIVCGHRSTDALNTDTNILYAFSATGGNVVTERLLLTDTGFVARSRDAGGPYPDLSLSGRTYDYIAFR